MGELCKKNIFDGILWSAYGTPMERPDSHNNTTPSGSQTSKVGEYLIVVRGQTSPVQLGTLQIFSSGSSSRSNNPRTSPSPHPSPSRNNNGCSSRRGSHRLIFTTGEICKSCIFDGILWSAYGTPMERPDNHNNTTPSRSQTSKVGEYLIVVRGKTSPVQLGTLQIFNSGSSSSRSNSPSTRPSPIPVVVVMAVVVVVVVIVLCSLRVNYAKKIFLMVFFGPPTGPLWRDRTVTIIHRHPDLKQVKLVST